MPSTTPGLARRSLRLAQILALACLATTAGCADFAKNVGDYFNLRNSFLAPNEVGRFDKASPWGNVRPVTWPILEQLDVVDEPADRWANATEPLPADTIPTTHETLLGPGDLVRVTVYELVAKETEYQREAQVSETGNITIQNIGSVNIAGLTAREAEEKIGQIAIERKILLPASDNPPRPGPQVTVTILSSRANTYSILGAVNQPGPNYILGSDYRLLDALAAARDVVSNTVVQNIYVIRQGPHNNRPLSEAAPGERPLTGEGTTGNPTPQNNPLNALESIENATTTPSTPPAPTPTPSALPGPQSTGPAFVRPMARADVTDATGAPRGGLTQADLDAAISGGQPVATTTPPAGAAAATAPAGGDMMDQAMGGYTGTGSGQSAYVGGKLVQVPSTAPAATPTGGISGPPSPDAVANAERTATQRVIKIPLDALKAGVARYNIVIRPGDVIIAQGAENSYFYIMGHVQKPGVYALVGQKITLKMAVAAAGNLDSLAIPRRCELWRRLGNNQEVVVQVNLQKIFDGEQPDLFLKPNDLLNVGSDAVAPFLAVTRNAYRLSYGFGFVYDRNFYIQPQKLAQ